MTPPDHLDQLEFENGMGNMARLVRVFYVGLIESGFTPEEAQHYTSTWLATTIAAGAHNARPEAE